MVSKILVTGATGTIGSRIVERLCRAGLKPRVFVRDSARAIELFGSDTEVVNGDADDRASVAQAVCGIDTMLLINVGTRIAARDKIAIEEANIAGITKIVKISSLDAPEPDETDTIASWHRQGEAHVSASGISHNIVRSSALMTNVLHWKHSILANAKVFLSTGDGAIGIVDPDDVADVAVQCLLQNLANQTVIGVTGPQLLTYDDMVATIGQLLDQRITIQRVTDEGAYGNLISRGVDARLATALVKVWKRTREGGTATLQCPEDVLGRPGTPFLAWIKQQIGNFRTRDDSQNLVHP